VSLFETTPLADDPKRPLAERMRPEKFEHFVGQEHILGPESRCARRSSATSFRPSSCGDRPASAKRRSQD